MERTESVVEERTTPSSEVLEKPVRRRFTALGLRLLSFGATQESLRFW